MSDEPTNGNPEAMTKVIAFKPRLVKPEPPMSADEAWYKFDQEHGDKISEATDCLMMMLEWRFGFTPESVNPADYTLLIESAISLCMRSQGIEHPFLQEVADKYYSE